MTIVATGSMSLVDLSDARQLQAFIGSSQQRQVIYNPNGGAYTPNYATTNNVLTPQLFIAGNNTDIASQAKSIKWFYQTNSSGNYTEITASDTTYTLGTGSVKTLTIKSNVLASNNSMTYMAEIVYTDPGTGFDVTTKAEYEIVKVTNGSNGTNGTNAIMAVLSNESANVPADANGTVSSYGGAATTISIFNGATDDTANWTITQALSGISGTASGTPSNRTFTTTGMSADVGTVTFTATRSGYATITKVFTVNKTKGGANATSYWLSQSVSAIQMNISKAYTPSSITFTAFAQTGAGTPSAYAGKFVIAESTDGSTFTDKYTSASNESSKAYTPTAQATSAIKAVRVRLYQAGVTPSATNFIDEQIIPIVADGQTGQAGADAVTAVVWTPEGNVVRNSTGTVKAHVDVYKGANQVTGTAFKWYYQDPSATTSSGGDSDGGNGWRLMKDAATANGVTGYTTDTITIPASAIPSVESFKCVVTYGSVKYSDVCTVTDVSDPYVVTVVGTNTFKNGQGTVTLTAKVFQAGVEVDPAGTMFSYIWSLYDANNVKNTTWNTTGSKTGKTITVAASDVNARGNVVCDLDKA